MSLLRRINFNNTITYPVFSAYTSFYLSHNLFVLMTIIILCDILHFVWWFSVANDLCANFESIMFLLWHLLNYHNCMVIEQVNLYVLCDYYMILSLHFGFYSTSNMLYLHNFYFLVYFFILVFLILSFLFCLLNLMMKLFLEICL